MFMYPLLVFTFSLGLMDQIGPMVCFHTVYKLRIIFTLLKSCKQKKKRKERNTEEYVRKTFCAVAYKT